MQVSQAAVSPEEVMDVNGKAGQPITLPLSDGPATGYSWQLTLPAGGSRVEDGPGKTPAGEERLGASTAGALQVTAAAGEYTLHARLARPWAADRPVRTVTIHLHVNGQR
jgi:predicted secreted protein